MALQIALLAGIGLELWNGQWLNAAATSAVLALTLLPVLLVRRFDVFIPPELEALALLFVFAALFLGEVRGYYTRYWWWDAVLHSASGFLLGIVGFLLLHVLNEKEDLELHMKPCFVALFSFMFALGLGALWEIFEFAMDSVFGLSMQKSGLVDTMWDLIVDAAGALLIAVLGYGYLSRARNDSFLERSVASSVMSMPVRACDTGQFALADSACCTNVAWSMPGTFASQTRWLRVILKPPPCGMIVTWAVAST